MSAYGRLFLLAGALWALSVPALALDEFGQRFGGETPAALNNNPAENKTITAFSEQQLANIEAAAGDAEMFGPPVPEALRKNEAVPAPPAPESPAP